MKNFENCEPYQLQRDLIRLIAEHHRIEGLRRIDAVTRLEQLERNLREITAFIASHAGTGVES